MSGSADDEYSPFGVLSYEDSVLKSDFTAMDKETRCETYAQDMHAADHYEIIARR